MPCGECMITLQNIAIQLGLLVDEKPVVGFLTYNWKQVYEDLLGVLLLEMKCQRLSLPWLVEQFTKLPLDVDVVSI